MSQADAKSAAEAASEFLASEFGQVYIAALSLKYNSLHQEAEDPELSIERKAFLIERAAGLKLAIDYLTVRDDAVKRGDFVKEESKA